MTKNESKYYNTSLYFQEALLELINVKDYEYLTVKEICDKAGVNRTTFYLHYDTIDDLLEETINSIDEKFNESFSEKYKNFPDEIMKKDNTELIFINHEFLYPYLKFFYDNRLIYKVSINHYKIMKSDLRYEYLKKRVLFPVLDKFNVKKEYQEYFIEYYINGVNAIVNKWINNNCDKSIEEMIEIIEECVRPKYEN